MSEWSCGQQILGHFWLSLPIEVAYTVVFCPIETAVRLNHNSVTDEVDINAPHREAAMFYGLFLRGHSAELLRRDIDVPKSLLEKWTRHNAYQEELFQDSVRQMVEYRKRVLQIFDELVSNRPAFPGIQ